MHIFYAHMDYFCEFIEDDCLGFLRDIYHRIIYYCYGYVLRYFVHNICYIFS